MSFSEKYINAMEELGRSPILEGNYSPPLHKGLRRMGVELKPPHYAGFLANSIIAGIPFGILWGVLMWLVVWQSAQLPAAIAIWAGGMAGLLFGVMMAIYYRWSANRHHLSRWDDL